MADIQSISLYHYNGAKALIQPFDSRGNDATIFQHFTNPHLQKAIRTVSREGACRFKFQSNRVWGDYQAQSVESRRILFDLIQAMQRNNMQLLCCADLNIIGDSAGTFFFQRNPDTPQTQLACIQLGRSDKIRIAHLPPPEIEPMGRILANAWKRHGIHENNKYGLRGYKLTGQPWRSMETSNLINIDSHKLIIKMLEYMESNGWSRVVSFDCSITDYDADSLLFFRESCVRWQQSEFCTLVLERMHKIRLIGSNEPATLLAFQEAVCHNWKWGVIEASDILGSRQIKCKGRPWCPHTTAENIASAELICAVLQALWDLGWRWCLALDMSVSLSDKSSFFLSRNLDRAAAKATDAGHIGCLQPKGSGKVNLVAFPVPILNQVIARIQRHKWRVLLTEIAKHGLDCVTIHFQCRKLHRSMRTDEKMLTDRIYTDLLTIIGRSVEGVAMLGSGDISGNYTSGDDDSSAQSLDTDVFFFLFP